MSHRIVVITAVSWLTCTAVLAQDAAAAPAPVVPIPAIIVIALILALMGAGLLVVGIILCHFGTLRKQRAPSPKQPAVSEPSTVPKFSSGIHRLPSPPPPQLQPRQQPANDYQEAQIHEEPVRIEVVRSQRSLTQHRLPEGPSATSSSTDLRHTASQFTEFLSHRLDMERARQIPKEQSLTTTFRPAAAATSPAVPAAAAAESARRVATILPSRFTAETHRYDVAMEVTDIRRSRASTPGLSAGDVELQVGSQDGTAGAAGDTSGVSIRSADTVDWFEEISVAL